MEIPQTTRDLCQMLRNSIVTLLRAVKDTSLDVASVRVFPDDARNKVEESDDSEMEDIFAWCVCCKRIYVLLLVFSSCYYCC